jgi:bacteriorhodopsin
MIYASGLVSLAIQGIVAIIDYVALQVESSDQLLKDLLQVEIIVQIIEAIFYIWLLYSFTTGSRNITVFRYLDWMITTPLMLITLSAFLNHDGNKQTRLRDFISDHKNSLVSILLLNASMLGSGLMGELGVLNAYTSTALGFIPFAVMFKYIKDTFLHTPDILKNTVYYWFVVVWGIYGVFALMPYIVKNTGYNILDVFSKNFFGLFLAYLVFTAENGR